MRNFSLRSEGGFTILEVVFAVSILAIGIMGYTVLKTSNRFSLIFSKNLSQAIQLTEGQLEDFWVTGFDFFTLDVPEGEVEATFDFPAADYASTFGKPLQSGDFQASQIGWRVRVNCPSELTKMVNLTTQWSSKSMALTQVQVRP